MSYFFFILDGIYMEFKYFNIALLHLTSRQHINTAISQSIKHALFKTVMLDKKAFFYFYFFLSKCKQKRDCGMYLGKVTFAMKSVVVTIFQYK